MIKKQYRKSPRAEWLQYNEGLYFVTVCTHNKIMSLGSICEDGLMHLSDAGLILYKELSNPHEHHNHIKVPLFVVMPNHFHAIIKVNTPSEDSVVKSRDAACRVGGDEDESQDCLPVNADERCLAGYTEALTGIPQPKRRIPLLSAYIGSLKSTVTKFARDKNPNFRWQSRYHDHAVKNRQELNVISNYIISNVGKWYEDCFYRRE